jgi:glycosyltransferase involved in cell wall biosynthesis
MKFVSITYTKKPQFSQPEAWFRRIRAYLGVLESLARRHSVISIDRIDYNGEVCLNGVQHHFPDFGDNRFGVPWKLNHLVKKQKPDIVLVQGMIFPLQVILLRMQLGRKVRIIVQNHAEKPGRRGRYWLQRLADRFVDAYLFAAREMGDEWVSRMIIRRAGKIREVMEASSDFSWMDRREARERTGVRGNPVFLWVGRLDANKDPLTVVRAFLKFTASQTLGIQPSARLYMIFPTRELLPAVEELLNLAQGGRESVVLVGEKPHEAMAEWYNSADYIISGSHYEGSGIAVCEAMSCGCIPVLTDILSFRKMTGHGKCGILYPPGDEDALATALVQITTMDGEVGRQKVLYQFRSDLSFEAIADGIYSVAAGL